MGDIAPTQAFPPWLVPLAITTTIDGEQVVQTSISEAPLTYFGPSIPLGDGWVFGSSTFPASIQLGPTSTSATTTPSPSSSSPAPSPSSSSPSPSPSSSSSFSQSNPTSSPKPTSQPTSTPVSASSSGGLPLLGKILIPIFVVLLIVLLLFLFFICYWRRRNRNSDPSHSTSSRSHLSDWEHIDARGALINGGAGGDSDLEVGQGERDAFLVRERARQAGPSLIRVEGLVPWKRNVPRRKQVRPATDTSTSSGELGASATRDSNISSTDPEDIARFTASGSTIAASSLFFNPARRTVAGETGALRHSSEDPGALLDEPPPENSDLPPSMSAISRPIAGSESQDYLEGQRQSEGRVGTAAAARLSYPSTSPPSTDRGMEERATLLTAEQADRGSHTRVEILAPSPPKKKSASSLPHLEDPHDYYTEGYMADEKRIRPESLPVNSSGWLSRGIVGSLNRFSWFRRLEAIAGPSGTRRSTPSSRSRSRSMSRHPSAGNLSFRPSSSRPHSGLLHPGFGSRPVSGYSFLGVDPSGEFGMRPPGMRISGTGSSAVSGGTAYHTASSGGSGGSGGSKNGSGRETGAKVGQQTVRAVDVLDIPAPETTLPLRAPEVAMSRARPGDLASSLSSRTTEPSPSFPPGLVNVQMWDKQSGSGFGSSSTTNKPLEEETLDDAPPRAQGDWSSLRRQTSVDEGPSTGRIQPPSVGERPVELIQNEGFASEVGSIVSGQDIAMSPRSPPPAGFGFSLTPRVSMHAISDRSGSHSSRPSQHTAHTLHSSHSRSQELSNGSSFESEDRYVRQTSSTVNRVSLSAVGGDAGAIRAPQLPPIRRISALPTSPIVENDELDRLTMTSGTGTRRGTEEWTLARTETRGSVSTGTQTTVLGAPVEEKKE